jgi:L-ascorbate metabolism protein UlaG (beta-lactamase superfamily)
MKKIILTSAILVGVLMGGVRTGFSSASSNGEQTLKPGEATIWYLGHSGYALKTANKLLIFDYSKKFQKRGEPALQPPTKPALANGWIDPEEIKDLDVVVFVSHVHGDHYDEVVRTWAKTVKNIHYVFGWDAGTGANVRSLAGPRASAKFDGLEIATVNAQDSGDPVAAFLVKVDGLTIYHNGDYWGKMGEDAPSLIPADMAFLKTKSQIVDIAICTAWDEVDGDSIPIFQNLRPKVMFPMHRGNHEEKYREWAKKLKKVGIEIPVYCPAKPGDRFEYRDGKIVQ